MDRNGRLPTEVINILLSLLNPVAPSLASSDLLPLRDHPILLDALLKLGSSHSPLEQHDRERELLISEQKVASLRTSIAHLTNRLSTITSRLAVSEASTAAAQHQHAKELAEVREQRDAVKALCSVWEARWREERRVKEDLETKLVAGRDGTARGKLLNDRTARAETVLEVSSSWRPIVQLSTVSRSQSRHSSSASSSSSSSSHETHLTTTDARNNTLRVSGSRASASNPRARSRQLVGDLSRELERVRREADRLLFERDEEILRLETEQTFRRQELGSIYGSLDTLLGMGRPSSSKKKAVNPTEIPLPEDSESSDGGTSALEKPTLSHRRKVSVIEEYAETMKGKKKSRRTEALEEEVRQLEQEVAQMGGFHNDQSRPPSPNSEPYPLTNDKKALASTIAQLNSQVVQLQQALQDMTHERAVLQSLQDGRQRFPSQDSNGVIRIQELERESQHLSTLLSESNAEVASLTNQLLATQESIEVLSARVRTKLLEQKQKLLNAQNQLKELMRALEGAELRAEEERRRRKALAVELSLAKAAGERAEVPEKSVEKVQRETEVEKSEEPVEETVPPEPET